MRTGRSVMKKFDSLELSVETVRELTDDQLSQVAGGAAASDLVCRVTFFVPSYGGAWTMACDLPTTGG